MKSVNDSKRLGIFTWHVHGSYLYYLAQGNYDLYIPVNSGYCGRGKTFPFGSNVIEVPAEEVKNLDIDVILFQTDENYLIDQFELFTPEQRALPKIYLEHDPPWGHPTDALHPVTDKDVTVVHVTSYNKLMWDNQGVNTQVINHGVNTPGCHYRGTLEKGIVVINNLPARGRMLGLDIFKEVGQHIPLDIVGMGNDVLGGREILHPHLPQFISQYRFFFNPIRYTSLGLAVCEAMMLGMPIVGLSTTEMPVAVHNETSGYLSNDIDCLIEKMQQLLADPEKARALGEEGQKHARAHYNIERFTQAWEKLFCKVAREKQQMVQ